MSDKYFVFIETKYYGPLNEAEVRNLISKYKISISNFMYDMEMENISMIGEHKSFEDLLPKKPKDSFLTHSYILIKNDGLDITYTYDDLKTALRNNEISVYNYVYIPSSKQVKRICDIETLAGACPEPPLESPTSVEDKCNIVHLKKDDELQLPLTRDARRFMRAPFSALTKVELEGNSYITNCSVIGEGGCFIELKNGLAKKGDNLKLCIVSELIHLEINVEGVVTSVVQDYRGGVGIKFDNLDKASKFKIREYISNYSKMSKKD